MKLRMRKLRLIPISGLLLILASSAVATPIRPDIKKLVASPAQETIQFAPARAGWNGPETAANNAQFVNPALERLTPAAAAREIRASMLALAVPDWRIVGAILVLIIVLRMARRRLRKREAGKPAVVLPPETLRRVA